MNRACLIAFTAITCVASTAFAAPLVETEPNDTLGTANFISEAFYPRGAFALDGTMSPGDVDFISILLGAGDYVGATLFDYQASGADSVLGLYNPAGTLVQTSDDNGLGLFSLMEFTATTAGIWTFAISGFPDFGFVGSHGETFKYKLVVGINPIPAPAAMALLGLAGLHRRRRRA